MYYDSPMLDRDRQTPNKTAVGRLDAITPERPYDGIVRRTITGQNSTLTVYEFAPNAEFPMHTHEQEQVTLIESGQARFIAEDADVVLDAGGWSVIASGVRHRVIAGPDGVRFVAIVAPARASGDYRVVAE